VKLLSPTNHDTDKKGEKQAKQYLQGIASTSRYHSNSTLVYLNAMREKEILEKRQKILIDKTEKL